MTASFIISDTKYGIQAYHKGWELTRWHENKEKPQNSKWVNDGYYNTLEGISRRLLQIGAEGKVMENANQMAATFTLTAMELSRTIKKEWNGDFLAVVPCVSRIELGCPNSINLYSDGEIAIWQSGGHFAMSA